MSEAEAPFMPKNHFPRIPHAGMLPWPERAVYFLREVLRYSRRNTALLLGMSDANIDQLPNSPGGVSIMAPSVSLAISPTRNM